MNVAARVIMNLSLRDHMKPALKQLHWLPIEQRITYKLCLFMRHIHTGQAPQYLSDCVSAVSALSGRYRLRSTDSADCVLRRTRTRFGERGSSYCGPAAWNTLPSDLHDITGTGTFRKRLMSVLFDRAYHWLLLLLLVMSYSGALWISHWLIDWLIIFVNFQGYDQVWWAWCCKESMCVSELYFAAQYVKLLKFGDGSGWHSAWLINW